MNFDNFAARYGMGAARHLDDDSRFCMEWLERMGFEFLKDFGYENAVQIARDHWNARRRAARRK